MTDELTEVLSPEADDVSEGGLSEEERSVLREQGEHAYELLCLQLRVDEDEESRDAVLDLWLDILPEATPRDIYFLARLLEGTLILAELNDALTSQTDDVVDTADPLLGNIPQAG